MAKATLVNSAGQKIQVESGSQEAQNYFGQGYKLDTGGTGSLAGTLSSKAASTELPDTSAPVAQTTSMRNLMDKITRSNYDSKAASLPDILNSFKQQVGGGAGVVSPDISGGVIGAETQRRTGNVEDIYRNTLRTINTLEQLKTDRQKNVNDLMGNLASAGMLSQLTGKEYDQIMQTGVLPPETLQKINNAVIASKNKPQPSSISEQLAAAQAGYTITPEGKLKLSDGTFDPIVPDMPTDKSKVLNVGDKSYNFTSYATDPNWGVGVNNILSSLPTFSSNQEVDNYIQTQAPGSTLKAQDIEDVANQTGVAPELLLSIAKQESNFMTAGAGAKTNNPGNVGNVDSGATQTFSTPKDGLMAMANNISKREVDTTKTTTKPEDYKQYGLLANTSFNPTNGNDKLAKLYLDYYIKNASFPTSYQLGMGRTSSSASQFANVQERAQEMYYEATGTSLPDVQILKSNKTLISGNNKLLNNLGVQEGTVKTNFQLAIDKMGDKVNNNVPIINKLLNPILTAFGDTDVQTYLMANTTLQNEAASLIAVKNASGTTVYDKMEAAGLIPKNATVAQQKDIIVRLEQEAENARNTIVKENSDLYKNIDPLEQSTENPNRQQKLSEKKPPDQSQSIKEQVNALGYDYDKMIAEGLKDEDIKKELNIQ